MKVIHVPFCFYPDPVGGTEVYVESLAKEQTRQGFEIVIAAPGRANATYAQDNLRVRRFPVTEEVEDLRELYGKGDVVSAQAFGRILDNERPDLVHLHAFTRGVSLRIVREAKRRKLPVIFSYHTPTVSCQRGTLLHWGSEVCDGVLNVSECARCTLHGHGLNKIGSLLAGSLPGGVGRVLGACGASGGIWTAVRMTELVALRHDAFRCLMAEVDHIVALSRWVKDLLIRNNIAQGKIIVSHQGLDEWEAVDSPRDTMRPETHAVRIAFLGRLDVTKGVHILIQALKLKPELKVQLDVMGIALGATSAEYLRRLQLLANGDRRVTFQSSISSSDVVARLRNYEVLAVPSQWLETGPRVILEAFAAGIPVIGSNMGGIAELVEHNTNGLLVEPQSIVEWSCAIQAVCNDSGLLKRLRSGIRPPRNVRSVANEMQEIYSRALQRSVPIAKFQAAM